MLPISEIIIVIGSIAFLISLYLCMHRAQIDDDIKEINLGVTCLFFIFHSVLILNGSNHFDILPVFLAVILALITKYKS